VERIYLTVFRVDGHEMKGDLLAVKGHFARTGIQEYSDGMGGKTREYRPPDQVFDARSLASWKSVPITVRHPRGVGGRVTADNWSELAGKGIVVGHVGDDVARADDGTHAKATLWISDASAQRKVQSGELVELSGGYTAVLDETPGTTPTGERFDAIQTTILGNHVSMLGAGEARGGPSVRILDSEDRCIFDGNDDGPPRRPEEQMAKKVTIRFDDRSYVAEVDENSNLEQELVAERKAHADALDAEQKKSSGLQAKLDAELEAHGKTKAELDAAKVELAKPIREQLLADAKAIAGRDIEDTGSDADVQRAALEASGIKTDGKDDAYVGVRFQVAVDTQPDPREDAVSAARPGLFTQPEVVKTDDLKDDERIHMTVADAQRELG
jgi:hypothetical protein